MRIKNNVPAGTKFLFLHNAFEKPLETRRYAPESGVGEIREIVEKRINELDQLVLKHIFVTGYGLTIFFGPWKIDMTGSSS